MKPLYTFHNPPPGVTYPFTVEPIRLTTEDILNARIAARQREAPPPAPEGARYVPLLTPPHRAQMFALVDEDDYERVMAYRWRAWTRRGYKKARAVACIDGVQTCQMSRFIMGVGHRYLHVHHLNGDTLDNRKANLQVLTAEEHRASLRKR